MKKYFIVALLTGAAIANAGISVWDGSDGNWMDAGRWSGDAEFGTPGWVTGNPLNPGDWVDNSNKSYAQIGSGTAHITSGSVPDGRVERIYVSGGALETSADYSNYRFYVGDASVGTVTQTAGDVAITKLFLGQNGGSASYTISGGSLAVNDPSNNAYIGSGGTAVVNQNGGNVTFNVATMYLGRTSGGGSGTTYNLTGGVLVANRIKAGESGVADSATLNISGGSLTLNNYMSMYGNTESTLRVIGSGATSIDLAALNCYGQTLAIELDETGSTLVEMAGAAQFVDGATLSLDTLGDFDGELGDVYDILQSDTSIDVSGLTIANLGATEFSYAVVGDGGGGQLLQVTVIPEPATLGLIALLGGGLLFSRRFTP